MTLLISIVSYLLKDIFCRWREQPGNVLTRFVVTYALVLPALGLLGVFALMAENLESRLRRSGVDMLFIHEPVSMTNDDGAAHQRRPRFAQLGQHGQVFQLRQLYDAAKTTLARTARVVAYPDASLFALEGIIDAGRSVVFLSDSLPVGMPVRAEIDQHFFTAHVRRPEGMLAKLFQENVVLVPEGMLPRLESRGFVRITLFKAKEVSALRSLQQALQRVVKYDKIQAYVRSSLPLLDDLESLRARQLHWRFGLAATAGGVLALVLGTLAILEYQQRAYVIALLRSFGIRRWLVYGMQLLENAFLVNLAGVSAYLTLVYSQNTLYRAFGATRFTTGLSLEQMLAEVLLIFGCINIGVLVSTLPAAHILRKDIGTILS